MTIKLLTPRDLTIGGRTVTYPAGALVTLDPATETGLINSKEATATLTGGIAYTPPVPSGQPVPLTVIPSAQGVGIQVSSNGMANFVTPGGYAERVVTTPTIADNRIVAVDYLPYMPLAENSTYILAREDATTGGLYRVKKSDGTTSASVLATALYKEDGTTLQPANSFFFNAWSWDDFQLAEVRDLSADTYYIYKSIDNFATCGANAPLYNDNKPVFVTGWNAAQTVVGTSIMVMAPWSLSRGENARGEDMIVFGQYNNSSSRTDGGANDWSNVLCSRRGGDAGTWEVVLEANTNGTNILRHCHAVMQDPYTLDWWIFYGDSATSGIYVWDGIHPIPANTPPNLAGQYKGWRGCNRFNNPLANGDYYPLQVTTAIFTPDEVIIPPDHSWTDARGVYSLSRDLTRMEKIWDGVAGGIPYNHSLYAACVCPVTGTAIASEIVETSAFDANADYTLWIYTATRAGRYRDWKRVARYMLNTTIPTGRQHPVFRARANGEIIIGSTQGAGKNFGSAAVCRVQGVWGGRDEDVIHPVWWIDPINGSDTNNGQRPTSAYKTLKYALTGNRVTLSSQINVLPGSTDEGVAGFTPAFNTVSKQAQANYPAWVRGSGRRRSVGQINVVGAMVSCNAASYPLRFSSITLKNVAAGGLIFASAPAAALSKFAVFDDIRLESAGSATKLEGGSIELREFEAAIGSNGSVVYADYANDMAATIHSGVVTGSGTAKSILIWKGTANGTARVENVTAYGLTSSGVDAQAAAVSLPTVRNVAVDAAVPVVRDLRTTKTSADGIVSNNVGRVASSGLVGGDTGSQTVAALGLVGTTGMPSPTSPLIGSGLAAAGPLYDNVGDWFPAAKNVGAFA